MTSGHSEQEQEKKKHILLDLELDNFIWSQCCKFRKDFFDFVFWHKHLAI